MELSIGEGRCEGMLPWGYMDPQGKVHDKVVMREMTGHEEDLFFSDKISVQRRLLEIVAACTEVLGDLPKDQIKLAISKVTPADFMYMLLMLRVASIGADYTFTVKCESCNKEFQASVSLDKLEVLDASKVGAKNIREYPVELPSGRNAAKIRIPSMADIIKQEGGKSKSPRERMNDLFLARVVEVNGQPVSKDALRGLPMRDRNALRNWIRKAEVGVDDGIDVECSNTDCRVEFKTVLDVGQVSFFFPAEDGNQDQTSSR